MFSEPRTPCFRTFCTFTAWKPRHKRNSISKRYDPVGEPQFNLALVFVHISVRSRRRAWRGERRGLVGDSVFPYGELAHREERRTWVQIWDFFLNRVPIVR